MRLGAAVLALGLSGVLAHTLEARPEFFMLYQGDPLRNPAIDTCGACHINDLGGGARNEFGLAFAENGFTITPMLRARFPDRFTYETTTLSNGTAFHFSDPDHVYFVLEPVPDEGDEEGAEAAMREVDMVALARGELGSVDERPEDRMGFFVTSVGPGNGGDLGGLAGADAHCQSLAEAAGSGDRTWRAYLSTSFDGDPVIHAGDRIGGGPWYNADGLLIARGVTDLHIGNNRMSLAMSVSETGERIAGRGEDPNRHDILTGTLADGTAAVGMNCNNWTSGGEGAAMVGHHDREGGGQDGSSWNAAHPSRGCSQDDLRASGGDGLFYCFAAD